MGEGGGYWRTKQALALTSSCRSFGNTKVLLLYYCGLETVIFGRSCFLFSKSLFGKGDSEVVFEGTYLRYSPVF